MDVAITREKAFAIFCKYNSQEHLIRHAIAVEACMRQFARRFQENVEQWGIIGLCHDIDYEEYPEQHCTKCVDILTAEGFPAEWIRSIQSHGWKIMPGVEDIAPRHRMEMVLYTVDQLSGLITATALMRPSRSLDDLTAKSVIKKWKDKKFAAGVSREVIQRGIDMLNIDRNEVVTEVIAGLRLVQEDLGLTSLPNSVTSTGNDKAT